MRERDYERTRLLVRPEWNTDGAVRRAARKLLREYAKQGRRQFGWGSVDAYLAYIRQYKGSGRVGGINPWT